MSAERCNCGTHTKAACDFAGACGKVAAPLPAAPAPTGIPAFNPNAKCSPLLTQCPRCNNPHHACDQKFGVALSAEQAGELPPLPRAVLQEPMGDWFSGTQMQDYARTALARQSSRIRHLERERKDAELHALAARQAPTYVPIAVHQSDFTQGWHPKDDTKPDAECQKALNARGDDRGQGLDPYWKWGFRAGWAARQAPDSRDAARYQWLVANATSGSIGFSGDGWIAAGDSEEWNGFIDAAIAKEKSCS